LVLDLNNADLQLRLALAWEYSLFNVDPIGEIPANLFEARSISKSSIVLSEDAAFDDVNTTFAGGYDEIEETPFILSFTPLSSGKRTVKRIFIDEYSLREKGFQAVSDLEPEVSSGIRNRERSVVFEWDSAVISDIERNHFATVEYKGADIWRDHKHFAVPWKDQNFHTRIL
jgi:hypothetical protein